MLLSIACMQEEERLTSRHMPLGVHHAFDLRLLQLPYMVSSHPGLEGLLIKEHSELEAAFAQVMEQVPGKWLVLSC